MAVRLSALRAGRPLPSGRFLVLISVGLEIYAVWQQAYEFSSELLVYVWHDDIGDSEPCDLKNPPNILMLYRLDL
jgi:hypothetical protein